MSKTISQLQACESLIREHRQMEGLLDELSRSLNNLGSVDAQSLRPIFTVMERIEPEMNTHFACEENALFPAVSPYHPMVLMEAEHEELLAQRQQFLALLGKTPLTDADYAQIQEIGIRFIQEMLDHIGREDSGIFPICEQSLSDAEKTEVIEGMERIRAKAVSQPTPTMSRPERTFEVLKPDLDLPSKRPVFSERLLDSTPLEVKHLVIQGGQELASHWTPKQLILICLKGEGSFTANDQEVSIHPGMCIVLSPQLPHGIKAHTDCHLMLLLQSPI